MSGQIYTENQSGALNQSRVVFLITDMHNGNIFQGEYPLSSSKHWVNCRSQQDWRSVPLPGAERPNAVYFTEDLGPYWRWIIGMYWRPLTPVEVTPSFLLGGTRKRSATPFQALHHSQTYYKLSNHLAKDKKKVFNFFGIFAPSFQLSLLVVSDRSHLHSYRSPFSV